MEQINIKIKLNVAYELATELYDEIEGHLALCLEGILERQPLKVKGLSADFVSYDPTSLSKLQQMLSPNALSEFLSEKLGNPIKVENVEVFQSATDLSKNVAMYITVPNLWAASYGKESNVDLDSALDFFKQTPASTRKFSEAFKQLEQRLDQPLIGSMQYDQLSHSMKRWDGTTWHTL
jgi:hypothetical protein